MDRRESLEATKLDYLRGRLDEAERDALTERRATYAPGLLERLDEEIEGESTGTAVRRENRAPCPGRDRGNPSHSAAQPG